jgi:hypothetical protein
MHRLNSWLYVLTKANQLETIWRRIETDVLRRSVISVNYKSLQILRYIVKNTVLVAIVLVSLYTLPMHVAADDWPDSDDNCDSAPFVGSGTISGTMDTSPEIDTFRVMLDEGDTVTFYMDVPPAQEDMIVWHDGYVSLDNPENVAVGDGGQ